MSPLPSFFFFQKLGRQCGKYQKWRDDCEEDEESETNEKEIAIMSLMTGSRRVEHMTNLMVILPWYMRL